MSVSRIYRSESLLRKDLKKAWRYKIIGIESRYQRGIPDVNVMFEDGGGGWVELKVVHRALREGEKEVYFTPLRLEQAIFLDAWESSGGRCGVLVGSYKGFGLLFRGPYRALTCGRADVSDAVWNGNLFEDLERLEESLGSKANGNGFILRR